jgi:predicted TIM-barrel fold metal-dependent hydrolase
MQTIRPPHPDPRPPDTKLPPGAIDTQVHIYGPPERYPLKPDALYTPHMLGLDTAEAMHRKLGIERGVLVSPTVYGTDNRCMIDTLKTTHAGRWRGVAVIGDETTQRDLDEMNEVGVRGARCNFASFLNMTPDEGLFRRTVERIAPMGWHVVLHVLAEDLIAHEALFREVRIPVVVDHMAHLHLDDADGARAFDLLVELVGQDNWWIKLSNGDRISDAGPPYDDVVTLGRTLAEAAPARALWGTDWPHVLYRKENMVNDGDMVDLLARYVPDEAARNRILVENPQELYGFSGKIP